MVTIPEHVNGLLVEVEGKNGIIIHAEDFEGSDKVVELNRALHVVNQLRAKIEADPFRTVRYRMWIQTANGSLMTVSETKQAICFIQPFLRFGGESPSYVEA